MLHLEEDIVVVPSHLTIEVGIQAGDGIREDLLTIEQLDIEDKEPLRVEQESFLGAVADRSKKPEVTGEDGLAALRCAHMILESIQSHKLA